MAAPTRGQGLAALTASAAAAAAIAVRLASRTVCRARRQRTWNRKQVINAAYAARCPRPALKSKELKQRLEKIAIIRRDDVWATEFPIYVDPRDERYQQSVEETQRQFSQPGFKSQDKIREELGIPLPPFRMCEMALAKMRGQAPTVTVEKPPEEEAEEGEEEAVVKGKKLPAWIQARMERKKQLKEEEAQKIGVDLSNIDDEFMNLKGIKLSRKAEAARQARRKGK